MNNGDIFYVARLSNFWDSRLFALFRLLLVLVLLFEIGVSLSQYTFSTIYVVLFSTLVILEVFFHFAIGGKRPSPSSLTLTAAKFLVVSTTIWDLIEKLLTNEEVRFFFVKAGITKEELKVFPGITLEAISNEAQDIAKKENAQFIFSLYLFIGFLFLSEPKTKLLFKKELKEEDVLHIAHWTRSFFGPTEVREIPKFASTWGRGIGDEWVTGWTLETKKYTVDLTSKVASNPPVLIGRDNELSELIEVLEKSEKKNALLIGPPGVGKTAMIHYFAYQSFLGNLPQGLNHRRVLELLTGSLVAGAESQGALEERIRDMLEELLHAKDVILYIPEMQNIVGSGGRKFDMSGVLTQALRTFELVVVGTITPENYKTNVLPLTSFAELFETVDIQEPDPGSALRMLEEKAILLERRHKVTFTYRAIQSAVSLSQKYVPYKFLPGKGIDLLDEVAVKVSLSARPPSGQGKSQVEKDDIVALIEEKTHVPVGLPLRKERETLLRLEEILHKRIIDQEEAVRTVSEALRRLRAGITREGRPVGTFLFLGPTGVGKTETAKALAQVYFGSEGSMIRLDMSEYQHEDSIHRLLGGEFIENVIDRPFSLVLFDEFEKAHPNIRDVFLQVFEDGRLTDLKGRTVSFVNTIIIATSNAGSELIRERILTSGGSRLKLEGTEERKKLDLKALVPELIDNLQRQGIFKTELFNRFDAIVVFEPLGEKEVREITKLLLNKVTDQLREKDITVSFDEKVVAKIAKEGFDPQFGARPLRRFIQDTIEDLLSRKILAQEIKRGSKVSFSTDSAQNITLSVSDMFP